MHLAGEKELLQRTKERLGYQYAHFKDDETIGPLNNRWNVGDIRKAIKEATTFEELAAAFFGSEQRPQCSFCDSFIYGPAIFHNDTFEEDLYVCLDCLDRMNELTKQ